MFNIARARSMSRGAPRSRLNSPSRYLADERMRMRSLKTSFCANKIRPRLAFTRAGESRPVVDIAICTRNRTQELRRCLESLSPLVLGFSMIIDYRTRKITFGRRLPAEPADFELPMRLHRLATVRGTVDGQHAANFVVDTGGEVISISRATAAAIGTPSMPQRVD